MFQRREEIELECSADYLSVEMDDFDSQHDFSFVDDIDEALQEHDRLLEELAERFDEQERLFENLALRFDLIKKNSDLNRLPSAA